MCRNAIASAVVVLLTVLPVCPVRAAGLTLEDRLDSGAVTFATSVDRMEFLYPKNPTSGIQIIVNDVELQLEPGFLERWNTNTLTKADHATGSKMQTALHDPGNFGLHMQLALERKLETFRLMYPAAAAGLVPASGANECELQAAGQFGLFGLGAIGTALGCATWYTGLGGVICLLGLAGVAGGVWGLSMIECPPQVAPTPPSRPDPIDDFETWCLSQDPCPVECNCDTPE